jgi:hypothetical protein
MPFRPTGSHKVPRSRYSGRGGLGIRRTSDGSDGAHLHTLVPSRRQSEPKRDYCAGPEALSNDRMTPRGHAGRRGISPHHDLGESNDMPNETYAAVKLEQIKSETVTRICVRT